MIKTYVFSWKTKKMSRKGYVNKKLQFFYSQFDLLTSD